MAKECIYQKGVRFMEVEKYNWALKEFKKIMDYKDTSALAKEAEAKLALKD